MLEKIESPLAIKYLIAVLLDPDNSIRAKAENDLIQASDEDLGRNPVAWYEWLHVNKGAL